MCIYETHKEAHMHIFYMHIVHEKVVAVVRFASL